MRGADRRTGELFSYVDLESRVRADHPLRAIREVVNATLAAMSADFAGALLAAGPAGHPAGAAAAGAAPAMLLFGSLGAAADGAAGVRPPVPLVRRARGGRSGVGREHFSKNRDRLLEGEVAQRFLAELLARPEVKRLLSSEHFSVDGTLIQAWASQKSFRRKDGGDEPPGPGATASGTSGARSVERHPCQHHRPGRAALPQGQRPAGGALLHRPRADGEPPRADRGRRGDAGHRRRRAAGGDRAGQERGQGGGGSRSAPTRPTTPRPSSWSAARRMSPRTSRKTSPRAAARASTAAPLGIPATRSRAYPQAHRGGLRLGEDGRRARPGQAARPRPGRLRLRLGLAAYNLVRLPKLLAQASP